MKYETSTVTAAEPERLWAVVRDVERWPSLIDVYEHIRPEQTGELAVGRRFHVKQKGLAGGEWTVTELEEGRVFTWESRQPGVRITGRHLVSSVAGGSRLTLQLEMTGWAAGVTNALLGAKARRYVDLECARLTAAAAAPATA